MSYEPKEWVSGEVITADKLNNIEEGIQDALECCEDKGFECTVVRETVFDESVTTSGEGFVYVQISPSREIDDDSIVVTFEGSEYDLPKVAMPTGNGYGEFASDFSPIFTNYPCALLVLPPPTGSILTTQSAGTYSVKIESVTENVEVSECFQKAVRLYALKNVVDAESGGVIANDVTNNISSGDYSWAEGLRTTSSAQATHAEGTSTTASNLNAHAEGYLTVASGQNSHAEGGDTEASNINAHAEGNHTIARGEDQHVFGRYNIADNGTYVEIVGNGVASARSNARTLDWSGNETLKGSLTLGKGTANETTITATQLKALLALL